MARNSILIRNKFQCKRQNNCWHTSCTNEWPLKFILHIQNQSGVLSNFNFETRKKLFMMQSLAMKRNDESKKRTEKLHFNQCRLNWEEKSIGSGGIFGDASWVMCLNKIDIVLLEGLFLFSSYRDWFVF